MVHAIGCEEIGQCLRVAGSGAAFEAQCHRLAAAAKEEDTEDSEEEVITNFNVSKNLDDIYSEA